MWYEKMVLKHVFLLTFRFSLANYHSTNDKYWSVVMGWYKRSMWSLTCTTIKQMLLAPSLQFHFSLTIPHNFSNLNGPSHFLRSSSLLPKIVFVTLVWPILYKRLSHFNPLHLIFASWSVVLYLRENQDPNIWRQVSCAEAPRIRTLGPLKYAIKARQSQ